MKKIICVFLMLAVLTLSACSGSFKPAVYRMNDSYPKLSLRENKEFILVHDVLASRMTSGTYEVENDGTEIKLEAEDGSVYYFEISEDSLVFDGEKSDPIEKISDEEDIVDGTKFDLWREY